MLADGGVNGVSEDKIIVNGKDLAHTTEENLCLRDQKTSHS